MSGCEYKTKQKGGVKAHKRDKHDIGLIWYHCDIEGCTYRGKQRSSVKSHKKYKHDIGVVWYPCDFQGCSYKAKQASTLKAHKDQMHLGKKRGKAKASTNPDVDADTDIVKANAGGAEQQQQQNFQAQEASGGSVAPSDPPADAAEEEPLQSVQGVESNTVLETAPEKDATPFDDSYAAERVGIGIV